MNIKWKKIKHFSLEIIETMIGAFIMAIATSLFLLPNQLSSGGFSGIATILYYFFEIPMGTTILFLNIPVTCESSLTSTPASLASSKTLSISS